MGDIALAEKMITALHLGFDRKISILINKLKKELGILMDVEKFMRK